MLLVTRSRLSGNSDDLVFSNQQTLSSNTPKRFHMDSDPGTHAAMGEIPLGQCSPNDSRSMKTSYHPRSLVGFSGSFKYLIFSFSRSSFVINALSKKVLRPYPARMNDSLFWSFFHRPLLFRWCDAWIFLFPLNCLVATICCHGSLLFIVENYIAERDNLGARHPIYAVHDVPTSTKKDHCRWQLSSHRVISKSWCDARDNSPNSHHNECENYFLQNLARTTGLLHVGERGLFDVIHNMQLCMYYINSIGGEQYCGDDGSLQTFCALVMLVYNLLLLKIVLRNPLKLFLRLSWCTVARRRIKWNSPVPGF